MSHLIDHVQHCRENFIKDLGREPKYIRISRSMWMQLVHELNKEYDAFSYNDPNTVYQSPGRIWLMGMEVIVSLKVSDMEALQNSKFWTGGPDDEEKANG